MDKPKIISEQDKQTKPMPGEVDPKDARATAFIAMQKAKRRLKVK